MQYGQELVRYSFTGVLGLGSDMGFGRLCARVVGGGVGLLRSRCFRSEATEVNPRLTSTGLIW